MHVLYVCIYLCMYVHVVMCNESADKYVSRIERPRRREARIESLVIVVLWAGSSIWAPWISQALGNACATPPTIPSPSPSPFPLWITIISRLRQRNQCTVGTAPTDIPHCFPINHHLMDKAIRKDNSRCCGREGIILLSMG